MFLENDYAPRFLESRNHNKAFDYFFNEWSKLPVETQDEYGVEYLLAVIELWVWDRVRAGRVDAQREFVIEHVEEHGPPLNSKHPSFLHTRLLFALVQMEQQSPTARTRRRALELIEWSRDAIRRLGHFGGPQSKGGKAAVRSLRSLQKALRAL